MGCGQSLNNEDIQQDIDDEQPLLCFNESVKWKITSPSENLTTEQPLSLMNQGNQALSTRSIGVMSQNQTGVSPRSFVKEPSHRTIETEAKQEKRVHFNKRVKVISFRKKQKSTSVQNKVKKINLDEIF